MNTKELLEKIISDITMQDCLCDFKFRKRDSTLIAIKEECRKTIEFYHWSDISTGKIMIRPIYGIKFDILLNWFAKFSFKSKQDQKDNCDFGFESSMLGCIDDDFSFNLSGMNYKTYYMNFEKTVLYCAEKVFTDYASLPMVYNTEIKPILEGKKELPDIEIEWAFIDLTLCKIIAPQNYSKFKEIVMTRIEFLHSREEPNLAFYYDRLDEIIGYMEGLTIEELKSCKI